MNWLQKPTNYVWKNENFKWQPNKMLFSEILSLNINKSALKTPLYDATCPTSTP